MMRKRRRRPVEWIDTNFSSAPDYDGAFYGILPFMSITYTASGASPYVPVINNTPLLIGDEPAFDLSLMEERKSYTIRRIVGDMHFLWGAKRTVGGSVQQTNPAMVKWGFAVQNVPPDDNNLVAGPERIWNPFNSSQADFTEMDWMHVRSEIYGANYEATVNASTGAPTNLADNTFVNSATQIIDNEGGKAFPSSRHHHVDLRVNRTVRRNQRLFVSAAVSGLSTDSNLYNWSATPHLLRVYADLRVLINWKSAFNRKG